MTALIRGIKMKDRYFAHLYMIIATLIIAGSFLSTQKLSPLMHPLVLTFLRFIISFLVLAPIVILNPIFRKNILKTFFKSSILSLFYLLCFVGMFKALQTTSTIHTSTIFTLIPLMTAILSIFLFRQRLTLERFFIYMIGMAGTCTVIFRADFAAFLSFSFQEGDGIFFFATLSMSVYTVLLKFLKAKGDIPIVIVFNVLLTACIWLGLFLLFSNLHVDISLINFNNVWYLLYLSIPSTLITLYLYQKASITISPKSLSAYSYLNPPLVAIIALIFENAQISFGVYIGISLSLVVTFLLAKDG